MKEKLEAIREDMEAALKKVGETYGVKFDVGRMTYGRDNFSVKVEAIEVNGESDEDFEKLNWNRSAVMYGFSEEDFGKTVCLRGEQFIVCGINVKSRKYPILANRSGNAKRVFKFSRAEVRLALA